MAHEGVGPGKSCDDSEDRYLARATYSCCTCRSKPYEDRTSDILEPVLDISQVATTAVAVLLLLLLLHRRNLSHRPATRVERAQT